MTLRWLAGGSYLDICFAFGVGVGRVDVMPEDFEEDDTATAIFMSITSKTEVKCRGMLITAAFDELISRTG